MKNFVSVSLFLTISAALFAQDNVWRDPSGKPAPRTESRNSVNGFGGWLLITSDANWRAKWDTPSNTAPQFNEAKTVGRGKEIFVLFFFVNPQVNNSGAADVTCDIEVVRPDGGSAVHNVNAVCFKGELKGPQNVHLGAPVIGLRGDAKDPAGKWLVHVTLKDNIRHVSLPLKTSFVLQ